MEQGRDTDVFLLLIDVPNLEPDIGMSEWTRRVAKDTVKTSKGFLIFPLLFIDDTEAEEYFIGLIEILVMGISKTRRKIGRSQFTFVHAENGRESLLGVVERAIPIIEDTNAVPKFRILLRGR